MSDKPAALTSNQKLIDLRMVVDQLQKPGGWERGALSVLWAAAEIEKLDGRLTAALDIYEIVKAERDRLQAERSELAQRYVSAVAQISNLRAALRNISKGRVGDQLIMNVSEYAKAQLAGAAVETAAVPSDNQTVRQGERR